MSDKPPSPYLVAVSDETRTAAKHHAPAAARNTGPILEVLGGILPGKGRALEIASGTGQHAAAFAAAFPGIGWQPSDPAEEARNSIAAWLDESGLGNLHPPLDLDVIKAGWHSVLEPGLDLVVCINMIHISPWEACEGLLAGAGALLRGGGILYLYGPYKRGGKHTAPSNEEFDRSLRGRNPAWGVRDMEEVTAAAAAHGTMLEQDVAMPANNFSLVFRKNPS